MHRTTEKDVSTKVAVDTTPKGLKLWKQGRRKESRARGDDRSKIAPTTIGQQIYPRNGGHPRHF